MTTGTTIENWGTDPAAEIGLEINYHLFDAEIDELPFADWSGNYVPMQENRPKKLEAVEDIGLALVINNALATLNSLLQERLKIAWTLDAIEFEAGVRLTFWRQSDRKIQNLNYG